MDEVVRCYVCRDLLAEVNFYQLCSKCQQRADKLLEAVFGKGKEDKHLQSITAKDRTKL